MMKNDHADSILSLIAANPNLSLAYKNCRTGDDYGRFPRSIAGDC